MKAFHRCFWVLVCLTFIATACAQTPHRMPRLGRHISPRHQMANLLSKKTATAQSGMNLAPADSSNSKIWDLGVYPGGTTAELQAINDFGVAMGWGDVPTESGTETRMIGIPLFGVNAGQWFESGVTTGEDWTGEGGGISNTGMIVGNILSSNGWPEAYAWMPGHGGFHLGKYQDDDGSVAIAINHSGTLITGNSGKLLEDGTMRVTPIVWTSKATWKDGRPTLSWEMHALPTAGLEKTGAVFEGKALNFWGGWGVNDLGQIAGDGWTSDADDNYWEIAVVWVPTKPGKEWKIERLPNATGHTYNEALGINDFGEVVGDVWGWTDNPQDYQGAFPALWKKSSNKQRTWLVTVLPTTSGQSYGWSIAWGINELGDIVGWCTDENWIGNATRWNTHNPDFVKSLGLPGDTSVAFGVNDLGIVTGGYQNFIFDENGNQEFDENGSAVLTPQRAVAVRFR